MIRILPLIILLLCSACIQLGGEPQPVRFYLLEPIDQIDTISRSKQINLEFSPIDFPIYLDRPQIVSRTQSNLIQIADHDRWAEPLPDNLSRTLQENLFKLLDGIQISSAPWSLNDGPAYRVKLIVNRFDGILGQQTEVDIRWSLFDSHNNRELQRKHFRAKLPIGDSYRNLVDGLNSALAMLSQEIAADLIDRHE